MFTLQVIQEQVEYDEMDLVLIFSRKIWVTARLFCDLLIARATYGTGHNIEGVPCKLIHS
jgi:hypothetical protein